MTRTQIQFPDPLYHRLKQIAERNDWSLAEVVRRAADLYVDRFTPQDVAQQESWDFPTLEMGGNFLQDPADVRIESDVLVSRSK
jgi:hypothetical protein